jgi:hypothetical protein
MKVKRITYREIIEMPPKDFQRLVSALRAEDWETLGIPPDAARVVWGRDEKNNDLVCLYE